MLSLKWTEKDVPKTAGSWSQVYYCSVLGHIKETLSQLIILIEQSGVNFCVHYTFYSNNLKEML